MRLIIACALVALVVVVLRVSAQNDAAMETCLKTHSYDTCAYSLR